MRKMSQTIMQLMICFPIWISQSQQPVTFRNRKGGGDEALRGGTQSGNLPSGLPGTGSAKEVRRRWEGGGVTESHFPQIIKGADRCRRGRGS